MKRSPPGRFALLLAVILCAVLAGGASRVVQDQCGPFTDVTPGFCPYILEMYYLGITVGTSATTFSPDDPLTRGQGAVFIAKGINQTLARSSRRAALGQWWQPSFFTWTSGLGITPLPDYLVSVVCDGADVWVVGSGSVFRVRASDGKLLGTWTPGGGMALLAAMGRIFFSGASSVPGQVALFAIDPSGPVGAAEEVATLPFFPISLAFDGASIWAANYSASSLSIVNPSPTTPWPVTTVKDGFQAPSGLAFDGKSIWVTDTGACTLLRLDASGAVTQTVVVGSPQCIVGRPVFDGANLLVPTFDALQVIHASDGTVAATIPIGAESVAFDGERILVEKHNGGQNDPRGLTILLAGDFTVLRSEPFEPFGGPRIGGVASDGVNFWVTFEPAGGQDVLARY